VAGAGITYYAVDHSPSSLWNSVTWEISEALLPFLETVLGGPSAWDGDESVRRAIEIRDGVVRNPPSWPSSTARRRTRTSWSKNPGRIAPRPCRTLHTLSAVVVYAEC
jgi:hypothetical protein